MIDESNDALQDYCVLNALPGNRLSKFERLTMRGGSELQRALLRVAQQYGEIEHALHDFGNVNVETVLEAAKFYTQKPWAKHPEQFFIPPDSVPEIHEVAVHGLSDGEIVDLSFESRYQPQHPDYESRFKLYPENRTVHARMWRHNSGAKSTLVAIHGWTMGDQRVNSLAFLPGYFYRLGVDVVLVELPFHGRRRPTNLEANQAVFPSKDAILTNESMGQAISDLRDIYVYLHSQSVVPVGCIGMSLGAYIGALWASLDPIQFIVPIVPLVCMAELGWSIFTRDPEFARLKDEGLTKDSLRELFHVHSPLEHAPKVHRDNVLILAGVGDKIIPPRQPKLLWEHWGHPEMHWISGGHVAHFQRFKAIKAIYSFMKRGDWLS